MSATAERLTVTYPRAGVAALDDVTVRLPDGDALLVVGLSGSGKSTLLAALAGIVGHTVDAEVSGRALVGAVDAVAGGQRAVAAVAGLVLQDPAAQTCLDTVVGEIEHVLENRAVPPAAMPAAVEAALTAAGAGDLAGRATGELSGGQLQRVALAAALAGRPRVLLLDEPTALLDPRAARDVGALVGRLATQGTTAVVVEHRVDDLRPLPARTLVLDGGRIVACGPTAEVLATHGHRLLAAGCWVPTDVLLDAAGAPGRLGDPGTDAWLVELTARRAPSPPPSPDGAALVAAGPRGGDPVLDARRMSVSRTRRPHGRWSRARQVDVVHDVDLRVGRGEVVGVVGVNGCGKSTLLRGLAGLDRTRGTRRTGRTALVVQHPEQQLLCRTVAAEIAYGPRRAGLPDDEVDRRVTAALHRFGLHDLADRSPYRLSGGQQRRLSLACAVVTDVDLLLVDEPTFGLDRAGALDTAGVLRQVSEDGAGVVVVSHDLELLARCADRLLVLRDGRPVAHGRLEAVLGDTETLDAAGLARTDLLDWWCGRPGPRPPLRSLLGALDAAVSAR
ncbi:energy-coupling factor ABC transporter ATP-binding protein [Isoptericola sp. NEAU-Y5]|uniref:Energy-coupling factor ABC transporter ATP-binding protein n=1 Tax=Isoptericola luteus TaxID=2879484 RepID=A0ABS7ZHW7_9MICO|nr:ABC transporter ATP-binding protein [Isoptericola sp. NEAU-Y5]MCA5894057.1 energy-coupling factor ABC transporter ATP-binding protein [Isoptericola sp. NEAU-Y5]